MNGFSDVDQLLESLFSPLSTVEKELPNVGYMLLSPCHLRENIDLIFDNFTLLADRTTDADRQIGRVRLVFHSPHFKRGWGLYVMHYTEQENVKTVSRAVYYARTEHEE